MRSSPAVLDGSVFVGSDDGFVYTLDARTGEQQWTFETGGPVVSSPAVAGDTVYVGSNDGSVYALATDSGSKRWAFETGGKVRSSPAVGKGHVYIGSDDGIVYGLDAESGENKGDQDIGGTISAAPAVEIFNPHNDPNVFIGNSRGDLVVLWIDSDRFMRERTTLPMGTPIHSAMASPQCTLGGFCERVIFGNDDGTVFSMSVPQLDEFDTGGKVRGSPAIDRNNNRIYVGSGDTNVYAFETSADTKERLWQFETGGGVQSSPAFLGKTVYVGSDDGRVYGLGANDGQPRWAFETGGKVRSSPAVVEGAVFVGSDDNNVYALTERH